MGSHLKKCRAKSEISTDFKSFIHEGYFFPACLNNCKLAISCNTYPHSRSSRPFCRYRTPCLCCVNTAKKSLINYRRIWLVKGAPRIHYTSQTHLVSYGSLPPPCCANKLFVVCTLSVIRHHEDGWELITFKCCTEGQQFVGISTFRHPLRWCEEVQLYTW